MNARHLHVVPDLSRDDALDPLIPEGTYSGVYVRHDLVSLRMFAGTYRLYIHLRIVDPGESFGTVLYRSYRVKAGRTRRTFIAPAKGDLFRTLSRLQPTTRLRRDQINVRAALKGGIVKLTVRTVERDMKQRELAPFCRYSVVDEILGFEHAPHHRSEK